MLPSRNNGSGLSSFILTQYMYLTTTWLLHSTIKMVQKLYHLWKPKPLAWVRVYHHSPKGTCNRSLFKKPPPSPSAPPGRAFRRYLIYMLNKVTVCANIIARPAYLRVAHGDFKTRSKRGKYLLTFDNHPTA